MSTDFQSGFGTAKNSTQMKMPQRKIGATGLFDVLTPRQESTEHAPNLVEVPRRHGMPTERKINQCLKSRPIKFNRLGAEARGQTSDDTAPV